MKKLFFFLILILPLFSFSQKKGYLTGGFESNIQWYSKDKNQFDTDFEEYLRSNNFLKLDYRYENFSAGIQFESYAPAALLNYDPKLNKALGLATFHLNYQTKTFDITAGYFYEQFGSGLILRLWEDRQLGLNNSIRGGRVKFTPFTSVSLTGIYGNQRSGFELNDGSISALNLEIGLNEILGQNNYGLNMGISYVGRKQALEQINSNNEMTHSISGSVKYNKGGFYSDFEIVQKSKDLLVELGQIMPDKLFKGNALLLNMGYSKFGFGINATFRRLENMNFYSDRNDAGNVYNRSIINYLPSLTKQHEYSLANIYIYQTQSNLSFNPLAKAGEIGFQIDVFYQIKKRKRFGWKVRNQTGVQFFEMAWFESRF